MRLPRRRQVNAAPSLDPSVEQQLQAADTVISFEHRLATDKAFRDGFARSMKEALLRAEVADALDSKLHGSDYGWAGEQIPDAVHSARGGTFLAILRWLEHMTDAEELPTAEEMMSNLRSHIGEGVNDAYTIGLHELPPPLTDKRIIGIVTPNEGWIVSVDRLPDPHVTVGELQDLSRQKRAEVIQSLQDN